MVSMYRNQSVTLWIHSSTGIGGPIVKPEVNLSNFLERQRLTDDTDLLTISGASKDDQDDEDVDTTLAHISSYPNPQATSWQRREKLSKSFGTRNSIG